MGLKSPLVHVSHLLQLAGLLCCLVSLLVELLNLLIHHMVLVLKLL